MERGHATEAVPQRLPKREPAHERGALRAPGMPRMPRRPGARRPASVGADPPPRPQLPRFLRDRSLGVLGLLGAFGSAIWAMAGGNAMGIGAILVIALAVTIADAFTWRAASTDLTVPDGARLPSAPWGLLVGPAAGLGLVGAIAAGLPVLIGASALLLVVSLAGAFARFPAESLPMRPVGHANRLRQFLHDHGGEVGERLPGYVVYLGEGASRLFVFAPDGGWADAVIRQEDVPTVLLLARVDLMDPADREAGRKLGTGPVRWNSMIASW